MKILIILLCLTFQFLHLNAGIGMSKQELIKMYSINIDSIVENSKYETIFVSIGNIGLYYDNELNLVVKQTIYSNKHTKISEFNEILYNNYMYSDGWYYYQKHSVNYDIFVRIYYVEYFDFYVIEFILENV